MSKTLQHDRSRQIIADGHERQLLGGLMRNGDGASEVVGLVQAGHFRTHGHQLVYRAVAALHERQRPICLVTVAEELMVRKWIDDLGGGGPGSAYLAELFDSEPTGANLRYDAKNVMDNAMLRNLERTAREIVTIAEDPRGPAEEVLAHAEQAIFAIGQQRLALTDDERSLREVVNDTFDYINVCHRAGGCSGIPTGWPSLDAVLAGLQSSELVIVAARPSVGKTGFALAVASHVAVVERRHVFFVSLEQASRELGQRLLCGEASVDGQRIRQALLNDDEHRRLHEAGQRLREAPLTISDYSHQTLTRIASKARRRKSRGELDLLIVDYLQLIEPDNRRDPRHEQVGQISRGLKRLARDLKIPVLVLAQVNRASEARTDRRPRLGDLRESGSIEADADTVLLLHKPDDHPDQLLVHIAKQRNGPTDEQTLSFDRRTGRLLDPAAESGSPF